MNRSILCGALLGAAVFTPLSWAQTPPPPVASAAWPGAPRPAETARFGPASDPLNAQVPVPALNARSSLSDYRPYKDAEVGPWRQVNDRVRDVGGWKAYARLSQEPDVPEGAKPPQSAPASSPAQTGTPQAPVQKPVPGGHAGHGH